MRYLFPGDAVWLPANAEGISKVAADTPFTFYSDLVGGSELADIVAPDGITPPVMLTDASGLRPHLRGPDGVKGPMFVDIGAAIRYPCYSSQAISELLASGGPSTNGGTF
jgi:hypothetical protein